MVGLNRRYSLAPDIRPSQPHVPSDSYYLRSKHFVRRNSTPASGSVIGGSGTGVNAPVVAIDSKIEQAMDLVKTHLMFAVREEVEALRARIMELESTIIRLETENTILREHIPVDMLKKLSMQGTTNSISTAAAAAI